MFENFHDYWEARKTDLDEEFARRISLFRAYAPPSPGNALMSALNGGKKIRGALLCLVSEALQGRRENALPRAVAIELLQAASLIHDDYVDQDRVRRRLPAVWTLAGARRAVLLGDLIFSTAMEMMSELGSEDARLLSRAIARMSGGALLEPIDPAGLADEIGSGRWPRDRYDKIIALKTSVLFGAACELGARSAGAGQEIGQSFFRYGSRLGEAYQMADDALDIKRWLAGDSIQPPEMAALAPAFLYFVPEMRPCILPVLGGESGRIDDLMRRYLGLALACLEREIEQRLGFAAAETRTWPDSPLGPLLRRAPADLVAMFYAH